MKNKVYLVCLLFCLGSLNGIAQSFEKTNLGVKSIINSNVVEIQFYTPEIVRVIKYPAGKSFEKKSLSVVKIAEATKFISNKQGENLSLKSKSIEVVLNLTDGNVSFKTLDSKSLLNEKKAGAVFTDFNDAGAKTYSISQSFVLDKKELIYGLGILQNGKMSQRNQKVHMVQNNTWDFVTFFQSDKGYGLFWDNYSPTDFSDDPEETSFKSEVGDGIDYYFMSGGNADGVISKMRDLTGQVPMFPKWTFGFWQSRERYKSQNETVEVVKKYRDLGVPLDGIIQDWQYWGDNYHWNGMNFLNPEFPKPQQMIDDIHNLNAHLLISIWSSFGPKTNQFQELKDKNMLMDFQTWPQSAKDVWPPDMNFPSGVQVYDAYNPEARDIYWKYLNKGLFFFGIDGWWMDSTEPDHLDIKPKDFDNKTFFGSFRKVRNAYPLMTVGGVYDHQREVSSDKRVFILTRSAFAGQQRYGSNTWSGDVNSTWEMLRNQIPAGLNFSLCGIPYWNSDIGGFFAGAYNQNWNGGSGAKNPAYQELYLRWLQFGAFTPMMRSHGTDVPREIYQFGKKGEPIYDAIEKTINLRYALLPYIYSNAWKITNGQSSMMRALVMDFDDDKVKDMNNEYLFGQSILVAPIIHAQYTPEIIVKTNEDTGWNKNQTSDKPKTLTVDFSQKKSKKVYLPAGIEWYDFWTNKKYKGGQEINYETTINEIPFFVKAGSIIPWGPKVQYADEKKWDNLEIRVYEGADGEFTLYEDEGDNYNYEKGKYATITFKWNDLKKTLTISEQKGSFSGIIKERQFKVVKASSNTGISDIASEKIDKLISYSGNEISIKL
ncbi:glycoside hydrolase family 31 protein [Flavobacterium sp. MMLR14_040]|uniref:glycoside hydrolase family 31 protein n=1 Tax=Flavobacterium sp. MMLR14_040 TaxID=3093843 RepID=UPI00298FF758|nr:TIM-barrel domain-containing protein [Flavobacterium sp. MMLR14_040]MDW8852164.1 glycoside hydrolase family 31 protein [Flavobacterium sp. MMLR14_040]